MTFIKYGLYYVYARLSHISSGLNRSILKSIRLDCIKYRVSRAAKRKFDGDFLQLPGTYIQQAHISKSVKGKSSSTTKIRTKFLDKSPEPSTDTEIVNETTARIVNLNRNKSYTPRPVCNDDRCKFNFTIICNKGDEKWYLRYSYRTNKCNPYHNGHIPLCVEHVTMALRHLPPEIDQFIVHHLNEHVHSTTIAKLILQTYGKVVTAMAIRQYRDNINYSILKATSDLPYGTPVERLIAEFSKKTDVSFVYVTHDINSGFVTCQKRRDDNIATLIDGDTTEFISVYQDQVEAWRKLLQIGDSQKILVAFAWCHDEELRAATMFPEFLACDTTFGVTKEQRNLFLFAGIDGNNKVFTAFRCFMPSKETRAYNWALRVALRHLLSDHILSYNQCVASDQELAMYQPLRAMMEHVPCMYNSRHRLDKYHLLTKEWLDKVALKVSGEEAKTIIKILLNMLSDLFVYVETEAEMNLTLNHFKRYYNSIKSQLKSEYVQKEIEDIALSIENKLKYICHCYFIDVTTFGFLGDSIAEAANSGIKNGDVKVASNMTINTSAGTQLKIVENQTHKKNK